MIDFVFVVDDARQWHAENLQRNRSHYSSLALLGSSTVSMAQNMGACIYYNPFVVLDTRQVKYGVIQLNHLFEDLTNWRYLYVR